MVYEVNTEFYLWCKRNEIQHASLSAWAQWSKEKKAQERENERLKTNN